MRYCGYLAGTRLRTALHSARLVALSAFCFGASNALAQTNSSGASATAGNAPTGQSTPADQLQEVIVTAQFRKESVQQTPLAITAVSSQMLEDRGQTSLAQITADVPSVTLLPSAGAWGPSMTAFIRGVGQGDLDPALEPGVGVYIDDVYFGTITGSLLDLLDVDRVEVLRGPQGTLEGMNSEGGAVKLFSKRPDAKPSMTFDALYGSRNHVEIRGSTNFVLVPDHLFIRLSGVGNHQDGYQNVYDFGCANPSFTATATNGVTGTYSVAPGFLTHAGNCITGEQGGTGYAGGRAAIRWVISDNLEATIVGDITNQDQENPADSLRFAGPSAAPLTAGGIQNITIPTTSGALLPFDMRKVPQIVPTNPYATYANYCLPAITTPFAIPGLGDNFNQPAYCVPQRQKLMSWGVQATVNWTLSDNLSLHNIISQRGYSSSWSEDDSDSLWPVGLGTDALSHHQFSEELRLNGKWGALLDYTVGGYYFRELSVYASHQDLWYTLDAIPAPGFLNFIQDDPILAHDKAAYLHTVWHLAPKLDITLGARYTSQDKDYSYVRVNPQGGTGGSATLVGPLNGHTGLYSATRFDYRGDIDYRFTDTLMAYAQVSTGFKGGGVDPRPFYVAQAIHFNPETLTNYELGIKSTWLDNRVRVNLDGYFAQYRNVQLTLLDCSSVPSIAAASAAAGFNFGSPCALPYNAGTAHEKGVELETQARFGRFEIDASGSWLDFNYVNLTGLDPATGVSALSGIALGMQTPFTSKWQGSLGAQYTIPFAAVGDLTARVDASTRSEFWTNSVNGPYNRIGGYTTYNGHLTWANSAGNWQVILQALNFTDKRYWYSVIDFTNFGFAGGNPAPPREFDIEIKHSIQ